MNLKIKNPGGSTRCLTLGISPCPNDVFIFSGILLQQIDLRGIDFEIDFQDVENLNQRAQRGELDILKISYANYIHCQQHYHLLPCGGALGRGVGPLLLCNTHNAETKVATEPDRLNQATVLAPGVYTTANFLLDYYAEREGISLASKRYLPFDALYAELLANPGSTGVVIHEKRFTYAKDGLTLIQDLGEYWERHTGYAIPLGAICVRLDLGTEGESTVSQMVRESLAWAYAHYEEAFALCRQYAQDLSEGVVESHIKLYVNEYSQDLGEEGEATVQYFLARQKSYYQSSRSI